MNQPQFCIYFALAVLAVWRVTHLLAHEDGPADLIVKLRIALGNSLPGRLMDCFKCLSLWIAVPAAFFVTRSPLLWLFVWLALSGAACLLQAFIPQPAETQPHQHPSEGDFNHVLWPEEIGSREHPIPGEIQTGEAPHSPFADSEAVNGAYRA